MGLLVPIACASGCLVIVFPVTLVGAFCGLVGLVLRGFYVLLCVGNSAWAC